MQRLPQAAMLPALKGLLRVMKPNGRLLIAVPDFAAVCRLAATPGNDKNHRFQLMRWLFGAQTEAQDFNLIGLDYDFLADYLALAGFARAERVRSFGWNDDASVAAHAGMPLSLNRVVQR